MAKIPLIYCSGNEFKKEEWRVISSNFSLLDKQGQCVPVSELFELVFRKDNLREPLLCDLSTVVQEKSVSAYDALRVPCIVEHAGLIFDEPKEHSYPGGSPNQCGTHWQRIVLYK